MEESAEAPPAAEEARRFRGRVPTASRGSGWEPADTTVSAGEKAKKITTQTGGDLCDCPQVLLSALPHIARKGECEGGTFDGFPHSRLITRPQATTFAQQKCCSKKKHHPDGWCFFLERATRKAPRSTRKKSPPKWVVTYGAGDEARTRYLDLGKVALYQMSYARKRKVDYSV